MRARNRSPRWYARCRAHFLQPEAQRAKLSRQALAHYRAIDRLPPDVGADLDQRGAPQIVVRWIAWAPTPEALASRYSLASAHQLRTGRWPAYAGELRDLTKSAD